MRHLNIDIETYSSNDIKNGVYKYADAKDFTILLFAYSLDGGQIECLDLTKQKLPEEISKLLFDKNVKKHAFNAQFERICLSRYLGLPYYLRSRTMAVYDGTCTRAGSACKPGKMCAVFKISARKRRSR